MFNNFKYRAGDKVLILRDLGMVYYVRNVYGQETRWGKEEMVVLDDSRAYKAEELTFYSAPIHHLANELEALRSEIKRKK